MEQIRTDLASEAAALCQARRQKGAETLEGIAQREFSLPGCQVTELEIQSGRAARAVGKPQGRYFTVELNCLRGHESNRVQLGAEGVAHCLELLLTDLLPGPVLVAGLGNRTITPDAIGPWAVESVLVTRHLSQELPDTFLPVSAVAAGVLGTTGVETGELLLGVADRIKPRLVIAIDALAARSVERLCATVQLTDTGIVPGSGVGNARKALNQETLGVPVIAIGVPTVVDGGTLAADLTGQELGRDDPAHRLIVTPRDIDLRAMETAKLVGMAINLALHGLSYEEAQGLVE